MLEWLASFGNNLEVWLDPRHIAAGGYVLITLVIFMETGIAIGVVMPGESLVLMTGMLAGTGHLDLGVLMPLLFVAAVAGDAVGFSIGRGLGPRLFSRKKSFFFRAEYLDRASRFYDKYGGRAIVLARFVPIVRTFAPMIAGAANMKYRAFVIFNVVGAALWVVSMLLVGYYLGRAIPDLENKVSWVLVLVMVVALLVPGLEYTREKLANRLRRRGVPKGS